MTFLTYYEHVRVSDATDQYILTASGVFSATRVNHSDSVELYASYGGNERSPAPRGWYANRMVHYALTGDWQVSPLLDGLRPPERWWMD